MSQSVLWYHVESACSGTASAREGRVPASDLPAI